MPTFLAARPENRGMHRPDQGHCDSMEEVFRDRTGAAFYRKEMLNDIGLFDADFFSLTGGFVYGLWRPDDRLEVHIFVRAGVVHDLGATPGEWDHICSLLRQLVHSWYPIKDHARPRSPLCPSSWLEICLLSPTTLHGQEGVILKSKIDAMMGLLWMPRKRRDVIHRASEDEISRFIYSWVETQRN